MQPSDPTTPLGASGASSFGIDEPTAKLVRKSTDSDKPVVKEVSLGGSVPRDEPIPSTPMGSGDIYIRLEGKIYGPFKAGEMEMLLGSGKLTGLEAASSDLHRWTPLAYHPRMVRRRVRDFDKAHRALLDMSALPAKKPIEIEVPLAAIVRRPRAESETGTTAPGIRKPPPAKDVSNSGGNET